MAAPLPAVDLSGQRALVTGAGRGIGSAIARRLAGAGAHVFINYYRNEAAATHTQSLIEQAGGTAALVRANLVEPGDIQAMFRTVRASGSLDILVHNAALGSFKPTSTVRSNQWDLTMAVNARALLLCAQQAVPLMQGRAGTIVALSSLGGARVIPSYGAIGVSKAALEALVRYLAVELAPSGVHVNAVAAGLVDTDSVRQHPGHDELEAATVRRTPLGRTGRPEDIADTVLLLCSPLARWIVGQTIVADGGFSLTA